MTQTSLFPVRPAATAEQETLPIDGTLQGAYAVWRATPDGVRVWVAVRGRALAELGTGASRVGVKRIVEDVRAELKTGCNNSLVSLMARELVDAEPALRGLVELRRRSAT